MKKVFIVSFILVVFLSCSIVASADSAGNDYVFRDYVNYDFVNNESVRATVEFPVNWYRTSVFVGDYSRYLGTYTGDEFIFSFADDIDTLRMEMLPMGGSAYTGHDVGYQFTNTHFIDLRYIPSSSIMNINFEVTITATKILDYPSPKTTIMLYFVDENGKVVYKYTDGFYAGISSIGDIRILVYDYGLSLQSLNLPNNAVGVVPYMLLGDMQVNFDSVSVSYNPFSFDYSMSALEFESSSNEMLQDSIDDLQDSIDNAVNAEVAPQNPNNSEDFNELHSAEENLLGSVQNYLNDGMGFFENAAGVVIGLGNGFQAIKLLVAPVFNLPFANGLILVSVSLGLIGSIVGLVSVASRSINRKSDTKNNNKG